MQFFKAALKSWDCLNCCPFSPATGVSLEKDGFVKQLGHWSNTFFVTSLNLWNWLSRHSVRPLVRASVDAGRENNILSCSSTTCCSAAELAEIFFFFSGGIGNCYIELCVLGARLNYLKKKHIYISPFEEAVHLSPPILKNVGQMHQNETSDPKCSKNSFSLLCELARSCDNS